MSRVTIKELYWEINEDEHADDVWEDYKDIEVVPRKTVEMIIEECKRNTITNYKYGNYCAGDNLTHIGDYAESLLKQFEEE